ncbi:MAG: sterol desaturase family protein [Candidatus Binataceae bacterium]
MYPALVKIFSGEAAIRLGIFTLVFAVMAIAEALAPRRPRGFGRPSRWTGNLGVAAINTAVAGILLPAAAVGVAMLAERAHFGLLNRIAIPRWCAFVLAIVALDLVIYLQHVLFHAIPILWRVHRMHHVDPDFDTTTGVRFHPIEIVLSMLLKIAAVAALGAAPGAVVSFEVLLNATSMFSHGNVTLPDRVDRMLRWIVVTPDMHRVHHSVVPRETNSNFGFNLPWWDYLLGTYRAQPAAGQLGMTIGIEGFRGAEEIGLIAMLSHPMRGAVGAYPLGDKD